MKRQGRIEVFDRIMVRVTGNVPNLKSHDVKAYYFRVRAANGKIVAQSEGYKTKASRAKGIRALVAVCVSLGLGDK